MNPKQTVPLAVSLAPLIAAAPGLLIIGGLVALAAWLMSDDDKEKKPETAPANAEADNSRKLAETNEFRQTSAKILAKPAAAVPIPPAPRVTIQPVPVRPVCAAPAPVQPVAPVVKAAMPATPSPICKKFVTRADVATIFDNGARSLTRKAAVAAFKRLGFGKTAAYAALLPDGRFAAWLRYAPDGIITWNG